jgi:hypothetical protein
VLNKFYLLTSAKCLAKIRTSDPELKETRVWLNRLNRCQTPTTALDPSIELTIDSVKIHPRFTITENRTSSEEDDISGAALFDVALIKVSIIKL